MLRMAPRASSRCPSTSSAKRARSWRFRSDDHAFVPVGWHTGDCARSGRLSQHRRSAAEMMALNHASALPFARPLRYRSHVADAAAKVEGRALNRPIAEPIDLLIFDCDGVLVDSEPIAVRTHVVIGADLGWPLTESEVIRRFVGRSTTSIGEQSLSGLAPKEHKYGASASRICTRSP